MTQRPMPTVGQRLTRDGTVEKTATSDADMMSAAKAMRNM